MKFLNMLNNINIKGALMIVILMLILVLSAVSGLLTIPVAIFIIASILVMCLNKFTRSIIIKAVISIVISVLVLSFTAFALYTISGGNITIPYVSMLLSYLLTLSLSYSVKHAEFSIRSRWIGTMFVTCVNSFAQFTALSFGLTNLILLSSVGFVASMLFALAYFVVGKSVRVNAPKYYKLNESEQEIVKNTLAEMDYSITKLSKDEFYILRDNITDKKVGRILFIEDVLTHKIILSLSKIFKKDKEQYFWGKKYTNSTNAVPYLTQQIIQAKEAKSILIIISINNLKSGCETYNFKITDERRPICFSVMQFDKIRHNAIEKIEKEMQKAIAINDI